MAICAQNIKKARHICGPYPMVDGNRQAGWYNNCTAGIEIL